MKKVNSGKNEIGAAFDGDADRVGVVDETRDIIWADQLIALFLPEVLEEGDEILFDVKCSQALVDMILKYGGKPVMWKTGHSLIKQRMAELNCKLGGEMSGHIFFKERWYGFDDALYTASRFIEIFSRSKKTPTELFEQLPYGISTPELRMFLKEEEHDNFMKKFTESIRSLDAEIIDIDGLRIEYNDGWGLVRPSNTSPYMILRFEADTELVLERIQSEFRTIINPVSYTHLTLPTNREV